MVKGGRKKQLGDYINSVTISQHSIPGEMPVFGDCCCDVTTTVRILSHVPSIKGTGSQPEGD